MPSITPPTAPTIAPQSLAIEHNNLQMVALIVGIAVVAVAVLATCYLVTRMARRRQEVSKNATAADIEAHKAADADDEDTLETKLEIVVVPTIGSDSISREPTTDLLVCRPERFVGVIHVLEAIEAHELFIEAWGSDDEEDSNSDEEPVADTEVSPTDDDDDDDDELPSERLALPPVPTVSDVASSPSTPIIEENTAIAPLVTPTPEPEPLISAFLATVYDDDNASEEDLDDFDASVDEPNLRIYYLDLERIPEIQVIPPPQPHQAIIEQTPSPPPPPPPPPPPQGSPKLKPSLISPPHRLPPSPSAPPKPLSHRSPYGLCQPPTPKATPGPRSSYSGRNRAPTSLRTLHGALSSSSAPASGTSTPTSSTLRKSTKLNALPTPSRSPPRPRPPSSSGSSVTPSLRRTPALRTTKPIVRTPSSTVLPSSITPTTTRAVKLSSATTLKATRTVTSYPTPPPTAPRTSKRTLPSPSSSSAGGKRTTPGWR